MKFEEEEAKTNLKQLSYGHLICTSRVIFAAIAGTTMSMVYGIFEPTLSLRLVDYPDVTHSTEGLIFGIQPLFYLVSTLAAPCIPKWVEIRVTLITATLLLGVSTLFIGPFFEDKNLPVMLAGLSFSGFCMGFMCIPNMAEMLRGTKDKYPGADMGRTNHLLSGMLCSSFGIGQALGPTLGAAIYQVSDFRTMCDVMGATTIGYALIYFICCQGFTAFR